MVTLSFGESSSLIVLLIAAVMTACCTATMDIALEAFVVQAVPAEQCPRITSAKLFDGSLGSIVGAGLLIVCYGQLSWRVALVAVTDLKALCLLPILWLPEARVATPVLAGQIGSPA